MTSLKDSSDPFFQVADNVLTQVFGEKTAQLIYKHLENRYALRQGEFSDRIEVFARGLESILQVHASFIERRILKEFCLRCGAEHRMSLLNGFHSSDFALGIRLAMQKA